MKINGIIGEKEGERSPSFGFSERVENRFQSR